MNADQFQDHVFLTASKGDWEAVSDLLRPSSVLPSQLNNLFLAAAQKSCTPLVQLLNDRVNDPQVRRVALLCALDNQHLGCIHVLRRALDPGDPGGFLAKAHSKNVVRILLPFVKNNDALNVHLIKEIDRNRPLIVEAIAAHLGVHLSIKPLVWSVRQGRQACIDVLYPKYTHAQHQSVLKSGLAIAPNHLRNPLVLQDFQARVLRDQLAFALQPAALPSTRRKM